MKTLLNIRCKLQKPSVCHEQSWIMTLVCESDWVCIFDIFMYIHIYIYMYTHTYVYIHIYIYLTPQKHVLEYRMSTHLAEEMWSDNNVGDRGLDLSAKKGSSMSTPWHVQTSHQEITYWVTLKALTKFGMPSISVGCVDLETKLSFFGCLNHYLIHWTTNKWCLTPNWRMIRTV